MDTCSEERQLQSLLVSAALGRYRVDSNSALYSAKKMPYAAQEQCTNVQPIAEDSDLG